MNVGLGSPIMGVVDYERFRQAGMTPAKKPRIRFTEGGWWKCFGGNMTCYAGSAEQAYKNWCNVVSFPVGTKYEEEFMGEAG